MSTSLGIQIHQESLKNGSQQIYPMQEDSISSIVCRRTGPSSHSANSASPGRTIYRRHDLSQKKKEHTFPKHSNLVTLLPFLDKGGVLRVGGQLQRASITWEKKHPCTSLTIGQAHHPVRTSETPRCWSTLTSLCKTIPRGS